MTPSWSYVRGLPYKTKGQRSAAFGERLPEQTQHAGEAHLPEALAGEAEMAGAPTVKTKSTHGQQEEIAGPLHPLAS